MNLFNRAFSAVLLATVLGLASCASMKEKPHEASPEERVAAYIDASSTALSGGDLTGALSYALQAEKVDPKRSEVQHLKALIFSARDERPAALECARNAVALDPKSAAANNTLGRLLMDDGKGAQAVPFLISAARDPLNREAFKPWTNLGIYYYRKGEYAQSSEYLGRAIGAAPLNACIAFYYRGHIRLAEGKMSEAIHDYDQSTRKYCADFADGHLALGIAYERSRQYDKARRTYLEIVDRFKDNVSIADQATHHLKYLP